MENRKNENHIAFIWRKTIYDNDFKCTRCGALLFDMAKNRPTGSLGFDPRNPSRNYCAKCKLFVAYSQTYDGPEPPGPAGHVRNARGKFRD